MQLLCVLYSQDSLEDQPGGLRDISCLKLKFIYLSIYLSIYLCQYTQHTHDTHMIHNTHIHNSYTHTHTHTHTQGYSTSETWYAVLDYGTNYCNLHNLVDGAMIDTKMYGFKETTDDSSCTQYTSRNCAKY